MWGTSGMLYLVKKLLMETIVATKWNQVLFSGPFLSNSMAWIFQSIQMKCPVTVCHNTFCHKNMEGLWNQAHHSHAVVWLTVCSLNVNLRIFKCSMAVFPCFITTMKHIFYDVSLYTMWLSFIWSEFWNITSSLPLEEGAHTFSRNLKILVSKRVTWRKFSTEDQQICYSTNLVAIATLRLVVVHTCCWWYVCAQ